MRTDLVEAALELFYRRGYEATGVQDIVDRAACTKGALYHYFRSKEELLLEIHRDWWANTLDRAREIRSANLSATEALRLILRDVILNVEKRRAQFTVAFLETRIEYDRYPEARAAGEEWRSIVVDVIDRGWRDKEFRSDIRSPEVVMYGIVGMCVWAAFHWFPETSDLDANLVGDQLTELVLRGLRER